MNDERSFERYVADRVAGRQNAMPLPDDFYDDVQSYASRARQRPEWLALIKEPPMRIDSHLAVGSPTVRVAAVLAATLLLAVALAAAGVAGQRLLGADDTIIVDASGAGDYTTIQDAVAEADDGDAILVRAGTYIGPVDIGKDISLRGEDRASVVIRYGIGCADVGGLTAECPDGTPVYHGFWFGSGPYGILLDDTMAEVSSLTLASHASGTGLIAKGGAPRISDVAMQNPPAAPAANALAGSVYVHDGSAAVISDSDLGYAVVFFEEQSPASIERSTLAGVVANTDNTPLSGGPSTIRDNHAVGITLKGPAEVTGNTIMAPEGVTLKDNLFGQGIDVQMSDGWTIDDNTVSGFTDATGIFVQGGSGTVSANELAGNRVGLSLGPGDYEIIENAVSDGGFGITVTDGTPRLVDNVIQGMTQRGITINGTSRATLQGNHSCGNGANLWLAVGAEPVIDDTNEICENGD